MHITVSPASRRTRQRGRRVECRQFMPVPLQGTAVKNNRKDECEGVDSRNCLISGSHDGGASMPASEQHREDTMKRERIKKYQILVGAVEIGRASCRERV